VTFVIKKMRLRDLDAVLDLWKKTPGVGFGADDTRAGVSACLRRNPGLCAVAKERGKIVGAVLAGYDGRRGSIHHLAVAPTCRRRGIGRALVEHGLKGLAGAGIGKCNIMVFRENRSGRAFWRKLGFNQRDDLALFQKVLRAGKSLEKPKKTEP
jgi:N-acetylglutamate synthase